MSLIKVPSLPPLNWAQTTAIALNLVPVVGVVFWGWSAFALLFLYWLENVVVGVRTLVSMFATAAVAGGMNRIGALALGAFFTLHYGLFCFGHGMFLIVLFGQGTVTVGDTPLDLVAASRTVFEQQNNLLIGFISIAAWQVVQFILFVARGETRRTNVLQLMGEPYPRIIALHIALIFGGFLLLLLNQPLWGLLVLTLVKMAYDVSVAAMQTRPAAAHAA